ncbi:MAG TPA: hypothetical protein DHW07_04105 [Gammaproteobacteria bacterium]|nr:hypothetical protein [Gammaproteobacteria bacterium]
MARDPNEYQIFYHVGLGKAASTYLQSKVFPKLKDIRYVPRDRYRGYQKLIERTQDQRYLISREAAYRLNQRLDEFAAFRADARVILVLRRHDRWIASHYRRYLKNGGSMDFERYADLDSSTPPIWGEQQMRFMPMIKTIESRFGAPPLVLFHEDFKTDPFSLVDQICAFTGARYQREQIDLSVVHSSWSDDQLKVTRQIGKRLFSEIPKANEHPGLHRVQRRLKLWACYSILGAAKLVPKALLDPRPLIRANSLERVRNHFEEDWHACHHYARTHNPSPTPLKR